MPDNDSTPRPGLPAAAVALWLAVLAFIAYGNTIPGEFVWDDASSILLHQHVKDPSTVAQLFTEDQHAFAGGQGNFYRPLLSVTFMVDYALTRWGKPALPPDIVPADLSPTLFHISSILWHALAGIALYLFLRRVNAPEAVRIGVCTLYIVHPLHTEAVAYISGRADSMAAALMFLALYFSTWDETARRRTMGVALSAVAYALALLSKESAFIYPVLLAMSVAFVPRAQTAGLTPGQRWAPLGASIVLLGAYAALRNSVLNFGSESQPVSSELGARIVETLQSLALYMKLLFVPTGLHMERTLDGVPTSLAALGALAFAALLGLAVVCARTGRRRAAFGFAWFIATWLPISGIFPLNAPMAEHWLYVPMAGFFWGMAELLYEGMTRAGPIGGVLRWGTIAAVAAWLAVLVSLTAARNLDWRTNESLYLATLRENPHSVRVQFNLGVAYQDLLDNPVGARRHFENVVRAYELKKQADPTLANEFWADELEARLSIGDIDLDRLRYDLAAVQYQKILAVQPDSMNVTLVARAAMGLGRCYLITGDIQQALALFQRAVELAPPLAREAQRLVEEVSPGTLAAIAAERNANP